MKELSIARRYAKAFFDLAKDNKKTKACLEELQSFEATAQAEHNLLTVLSDFRIVMKNRLELTGKLAASLSLSAETTSFLKLLVQKKRIELFPLVSAYYLELYEQSEKLATADLLVPNEKVAEEISTRVQTMLAEKMGRQVQCRVKVDESLLGGFVVQIGDQVFDASYKGRLERMKDTLLNQ